MVVLVALAAAGTAEAQELDLSRCGEIQPTLYDYYVQDYGQSYVDGPGLIPEPEDSEANEKVRYELRVHHCRWLAGKAEAENRNRLRLIRGDDRYDPPLGVPEIVRQAMDQRASQVGGEAAKQRNIDAAWETYEQSWDRIEAGREIMERAEAAYHALVPTLDDARGIFSPGNDPILDR